MLKPGTYKAVLASHAVTVNKKGNEQIVCQFSIDDGTGKIHGMKWYGHLSEKSMRFTAEALIHLGLEGNNPGGSLKIGKEVNVTVVEEKDETTGKTHTKITWINPLNEIKNVVPPEMAKAKLASLEGAVMLARQKLGTESSDDLPF